jgi:hypothetical protein
MSRPAAVAFLLLSTCAPAAAQAPKPTAKPYSLPELQALMLEPIDTAPFQTARPLSQVFESLREILKRRGKDLPLHTDREAFREENPDAPDVLDTEVKLPPYPQRMVLRDVLRVALWKVPTANATFLLRRGAVEVTTQDCASVAQLLGTPVAGGFRRVPLTAAVQALAEQTGVVVVLDPRVAASAGRPVTANLGAEMRLSTALLLLADMAGLRPVVVENVVYLTSPQNALRMQRLISGPIPPPYRRYQKVAAVAVVD